MGLVEAAALSSEAEVSEVLLNVDSEGATKEQGSKPVKVNNKTSTTTTEEVEEVAVDALAGETMTSHSETATPRSTFALTGP